MTEIKYFDSTEIPVDPQPLIQALLESGTVVVRNPNMSLDHFMTLSDEIGTRFVTKGRKPGQHRVVSATNNRLLLNEDNNLFSITGHNLKHKLPLHGEFAYTDKNPPHLIWFYCKVPSNYGGSTCVCDGGKLFDALSSQDQELFLQNCFTYERQHTPEKWKFLYEVSHREELEAYLEEKGLDFEWRDNGNIITRFTVPAVRWRGQQPIFTNSFLTFALRQVHAPESTFARIYFSNGRAIEPELVLRVEKAADELTRLIDWNHSKGMAIVDNTRVMHGRPELSEHENRVMYSRMSQAKFLDGLQEPYEVAIERIREASRNLKTLKA